MAKQWVDITTIDNNTPFMKVRWIGSFSINSDKWFSEAPGLTTDNMSWSNGSTEALGYYGGHRMNRNQYTCGFHCDQTGIDTGLDPDVYRSHLKDASRSNSNYYDTTVVIDGTTYYEIDFSLWDGAENKKLYAPYSNIGGKWAAGEVYVEIDDGGISIDTTAQTVNASGETFAVEVTSSDNWTASSSENWVTLSPASGQSGVTQVNVTVGNYTSTTQNRTATVTFTAGSYTATLSITQKMIMNGHPMFIGTTSISSIKLGNTNISQVYLGTTLVFSSGAFAGLRLSPSNIEIPSSGGTFTLNVKSSESWTLSMDSNYLTADTYSGNPGETAVTVTAVANTGNTDIHTVITATSASYSATSDVTIAKVFIPNYLTAEFTTSGTFRCRYIWSGLTNPIYYRLNGGNWTQFTTYSISVVAGDKMEFKSVNPTLSSASTSGNYTRFTGGTAKFNLYGNINSLLAGDDYETNPPIYSRSFIFYALFSGSTVVDASGLELPSNIVTQNAYRSMFQGCTSLTKAPKTLPAMDLRGNAYLQMFQGCSNLVEGPEILATGELPEHIQEYKQMFYGCSKLNYVKCLATDFTVSTCWDNWMLGVASTGTFVKKAGTTWVRSDSGIPSGWTVLDEQ